MVVNPWKLFVIGAIGTGVVVNLSFLTLSLWSPSIPVESHPYERGLEFQSVIDSRQKISERGWILHPVFSMNKERDASNLPPETSISFEIIEREGGRVPIEMLTLTIVNPIDAKQDRVINFVRSDAGEFKALTTPLFGKLLLTWRFTTNQESFVVAEERYVDFAAASGEKGR